MNRKTFLQTSGLLLAGSVMGKASAAEKLLTSDNLDSAPMATANYPLMDLHVHRSAQQTIEDIVAKSKQYGITFGVMDNIAPFRTIKTDADLKAYIDSLKPYPVYIGLQPMVLGWSKDFSAELIAQADYVSMDPHVIPNGNKYGDTLQIWEYATYIDDPDAFMVRNMQHYMDILTGDDPLNIFACPLYLPPSVQRDYYRLWTKERMEQVIEAARSRNIAFEINDLAHTPHEEFILMAKSAGLKFTFGSDTRNQQTGRLDYCKYIADKCQLTEKDFFIPKRKLG
ncbi:hypothetical protein LJC57_04840 [Parabacteroides sp. OttesenSCG-928-G07]|nr:hypothetical protein [Parabacteroides sp. OttesenSCG-928-G21]MDL2277901.1 hypothetical protein [Parabacteroides sp. OttesenSCG-928-G07]